MEQVFVLEQVLVLEQENLVLFLEQERVQVLVYLVNVVALFSDQLAAFQEILVVCQEFFLGLVLVVEELF